MPSITLIIDPRNGYQPQHRYGVNTDEQDQWPAQALENNGNYVEHGTSAPDHYRFGYQ